MPIPWHHEPFDYAHFAHRPSRNPQFGIRIDALTPDVIDSICLHIEATALAGDEARVMGDTYTPEEIEGYQTGHTEANRVLKAALVLGKQDVLRPPLEEFLRLYQYGERPAKPS